MMPKILLLITLILSLIKYSHAQSLDTVFVKEMLVNSHPAKIAYKNGKLVFTATIVTGTYSAYIAMTDLNGNIIWQKQYNDDTYRGAAGVAINNSNTIYFCNSKARVYKINALNGDTIWNRVISLPANPSYIYSDALVIKPDGGVIVSGFIINDGDWFIVNLSPDGTQLSSKVINFSNSTSTTCRGIALTPDNKIILCGNGNYGRPTVMAFDLNNLEVPLWETSVNKFNSLQEEVLQDVKIKGNYIYAVGTAAYIEPQRILKLNMSGQVIADTTFGNERTGFDCVFNSRSQLIVGGGQTKVPGQHYSTIAMNVYNENISLLSTYNNNCDSLYNSIYINTLTIDTLDKIYCLATAYVGNVERTVLIKVVDNSPSGITGYEGTVLSKYSLSQNYPNPFNPVTKIRFKAPGADLITIKVFDISGKEISTLVNQRMNAGVYETEFAGTGLPSGVYLYRMEAGDYRETKKMILLR
jgi:outer membrane protein assembly factor BamB